MNNYDPFFQVCEEDIEEMFVFADQDSDGKISYTEFQTMINPPKPPPEQLQTQPAHNTKRVTIKTPEHSSKQTNETTEIMAEETNVMKNKEISDLEDTEQKGNSHIGLETEEATKRAKTRIDDDNLIPVERMPDIPDEIE